MNCITLDWILDIGRQLIKKLLNRDREETSRNLQEFLPKTELMREHAEHTAIALNPPFSQARTAAWEAAGANRPARSGASGGLPGGGGGPLLILSRGLSGPGKIQVLPGG